MLKFKQTLNVCLLFGLVFTVLTAHAQNDPALALISDPDDSMTQVFLRLGEIKQHAVYSDNKKTKIIGVLNPHAVVGISVLKADEVKTQGSPQQDIQKMLLAAVAKESNPNRLIRVAVISRGSSSAKSELLLEGYADLLDISKSSRIDLVGEELNSVVEATANQVINLDNGLPQVESGETCTHCWDKIVPSTDNKVGAGGIFSNAIIDQAFSKFSNSSKVVAMINHLMNDKRVGPRPKYRCFHFVKKAIASGLKSPIQGVYPKIARPELERIGLINILQDPKYKESIRVPADAPRGSLLVYDSIPSNAFVSRCKGKPKKCVVEPDPGHIEIKVGNSGKGGFVSDYRSWNSRTGNSLVADRRRLIGVYVLPVP